MRFVFLLFTIFQPFALSQYCDSSYCNNRGICKESNGQKRCECADEYFKGPKCEQVIDMCNSKPWRFCAIREGCKSKPGEYFCPKCTNGLYGRECRLKLEAPTNLAVMYPFIIEYGKHGRFFIAVETRPQINSSWPWRFFTMVDLLSYIPSSDLRYSSDLSKTMEEYKIKRSYDLPYNRGYYSVHDISFCETGKLELRFELDDTDGYFEKYFYYVYVYDKDPTCKPKFRSYFNNKRETVQVDAVNIIRPKRIDECGRLNTDFTYKYHLLTYNGEKVLHRFKDQSQPFFRIPPYFFSGFKAMWLKITANVEERFDNKVLYTEFHVSMFSNNFLYDFLLPFY